MSSPPLAGTPPVVRSAAHASDRYVAADGTVHLSGVQALVRLVLDLRRRDTSAGRNTALLISGYEGSPLAGLDLELGRRRALLDEHGVVFRPALNEELAVNAVQGSQLAGAHPSARFDGVTGVWYGKAPGLDRASDALRHANLGGSHPDGGALVVVGDDATAKSSTVPSGSEIALAELGLPVLSPADPQDVLDLGVHGIALSRFSGLWVGMKVATDVADGSATVRVGADRVLPRPPWDAERVRPFRHQVTADFLQPTLGALERGLLEDRLPLAARYAVENGLNQVYGPARGRVGIIVPGSGYLTVRHALNRLGLTAEDLAAQGVTILRLGMVHPLDAEEIRRFADGLSEIVVVEEKRAFVESAVKAVLYGRRGVPRISGKTTPHGGSLLRAHSDLTVALVAEVLRKRLTANGVSVPEAPAPGRPPGGLLPLLPRAPFFCSGCPHNRSTQTPGGKLVGAGIGCHGMVALMPPRQVGEVLGFTQMGGEGGAWVGMAPFVRVPHLLQNMGDGTFHHSGSLAVRAAVAGGVNVTYKILYNSAVAMTGGQDAVGAMPVPALVASLQAEGVARIVVTTDDPRRYARTRLPYGAEVRSRDELITVQEELARVPGVTVLIHEQECATELRRKRKRGKAAPPARLAFVNERVCEGCGDCGAKSGCLSVRPVATDYGRKTRIHQASCNADYSCLDGDCPSFLTVRPAGGRRRSSRPAIADLDGPALPEPEPIVPPDGWGMRITGIGGTGVVTVAQIVAAAAMRTGRFVRALDQTGLSQKAGAVVSDVHVSAAPVDRSHRLADGEADLYLGCDVLVAAAESHLSAASADRTVCVVSTAEIPTGAMVVDPAVEFPEPSQTVERIAAAGRSGAAAFLDAHELASSLFGDDQFANLLLLGVAFQRGAVPLPATAIEEAIELNGVAVAGNVQAFRRGRQLVADPDALAADLARSAPARTPAPVSPAARTISASFAAPPGSELGELVARRAGELIAYQNRRYAQRYVDAVERVRQAEARVMTGGDTLTAEVARNLYKLMAYKDEYEVARLCVLPELDEALTAEFGPGYRAAYRLHPPLLRALGMRRKIALGPWARVPFRALHGLRWMRGTALDVFGRTEVRRTERALRDEFAGVVTDLAAGLTRTNHRLAVEIAGLPDLVRGYEDIKLRNAREYRARLAELMSSYARTTGE